MDLLHPTFNSKFSLLFAYILVVQVTSQALRNVYLPPLGWQIKKMADNRMEIFSRMDIISLKLKKI